MIAALAAALVLLSAPPSGDGRAAPDPEAAPTVRRGEREVPAPAPRDAEEAELLRDLELLQRLELLDHLDLFDDERG